MSGEPRTIFRTFFEANGDHSRWYSEDYTEELEKDLVYYKAIYNPLIDGAARDREEIEILKREVKLYQTNQEIIENNFNKEIEKLQKERDEAVKIINELHEMEGVPHLDDHFEFLNSIKGVCRE